MLANTTGVTAFLDGHSHADVPWTTLKNKNNEDTLLINQNSISLYYNQFKDEDKDKNDMYAESFITNQTNGSISNIVNILFKITP